MDAGKEGRRLPCRGRAPVAARWGGGRSAGQGEPRLPATLRIAFPRPLVRTAASGAEPRPLGERPSLCARSCGREGRESDGRIRTRAHRCPGWTGAPRSWASPCPVKEPTSNFCQVVG